MSVRYYEVPLRPVDDTRTVVVIVDADLEGEALDEAIDAYVDENYEGWAAELIDVVEVEEDGSYI